MRWRRRWLLLGLPINLKQIVGFTLLTQVLILVNLGGGGGGEKVMVVSNAKVSLGFATYRINVRHWNGADSAAIVPSCPPLVFIL